MSRLPDDILQYMQQFLTPDDDRRMGSIRSPSEADGRGAVVTQLWCGASSSPVSTRVQHPIRVHPES